MAHDPFIGESDPWVERLTVGCRKRHMETPLHAATTDQASQQAARHPLRPAHRETGRRALVVPNARQFASSHAESQPLPPDYPPRSSPLQLVVDEAISGEGSRIFRVRCSSASRKPRVASGAAKKARRQPLVCPLFVKRDSTKGLAYLVSTSTWAAPSVSTERLLRLQLLVRGSGCTRRMHVWPHPLLGPIMRVFPFRHLSLHVFSAPQSGLCICIALLTCSFRHLGLRRRPNWPWLVRP